MTMRVKIYRELKTVASLVGVVVLAFLLAWQMTTLRFASYDVERPEDVPSGSSNQHQEQISEKHRPPRTDEEAHRLGKVVKLLEEEYDKGKKLKTKPEGAVSQHAREKAVSRHASEKNRDETPLEHPSLLKILKIAADDFNLTCSHPVPMQTLKSREFIKESKNPCFWDNVQRKLRCVPYFYVPGFPKCGTTDFYNIIKFHPEFVKNGKEHHWINHLQFMEKYSDLEVYVHKFQVIAHRIGHDLDTTGFSRKITGDMTPDYLCDSMRWRCLEENEGLETPTYTNAHSIRALNPNAKFIIFMREPVERLYSRFKHMIHVSPKIFGKYWGDPSPEIFHQAALRAIGLYSGCLNHSPARQCLYNETLFQKVMMNDIGLYPVCLEDYLSQFPRENFLFLQFEAYTKSRANIFNKVLKFLDMAPLPEHLHKNLNSTKVKNAGHFEKIPMLEKTRVALRHFFSPFVQDLKKIVGSEMIESWGY